MQVTIHIPDQFIQHLVPAGQNVGRALLEEAVASAFRDHRLTMEQTRELLGYGTRMQVNAFLQRHEISDYTIQDLEQDTAALNRLFARRHNTQRP